MSPQACGGSKFWETLVYLFSLKTKMKRPRRKTLINHIWKIIPKSDKRSVVFNLCLSVLCKKSLILKRRNQPLVFVSKSGYIVSVIFLVEKNIWSNTHQKDFSKYHSKEEDLPHRVGWNENVFSSINRKKGRVKKKYIKNLINYWSFTDQEKREFLASGTYDHENKENIWYIIYNCLFL